jgi:hypothetical protein
MISISLCPLRVLTAAFASLAVCLCLSTSCHAQEDDALHIATARAALNGKDCQQALKELRNVSKSSRDTPKFLLTAGDTCVCGGDYEQALKFYKKYNLRFPGNAQIQQAMGDANYHLQQQNAKEQEKEKEDEQQQAAAEQQKQVDEQKQRNDEQTRNDLSGTWSDSASTMYTIQQTANPDEPGEPIVTGRRDDGQINSGDAVAVEAFRDSSSFRGELNDRPNVNIWYVEPSRSQVECPGQREKEFAQMQVAADGRSITLKFPYYVRYRHGTRESNMTCSDSPSQSPATIVLHRFQ